MAYLQKIQAFSNERGTLSVLEEGIEIEFPIKRIFYIYGVDSNIVRGGHRHHKNIQALICVHGKCDIYVNNGKSEEIFHLDNPEKCLILKCEDWHTMYNFSSDAVLIVLASEHYDVNDYIDEKYS